MIAQQGHLYLYRGWEHLALQSGAGLVRIAPLDREQPYPLGHAFHADAKELTPLPMRYYGDMVPA